MTDDKPYRDAEVLERLYIRENLTQPEIGDRLGCSNNTVSRWLRKHGIEKNSDYRELNDSEWVRTEYVEKGRDSYDIADELGCTNETVLNAVKHHGFDPHTKGHGRRTTHPTFDYDGPYARATSHLVEDGEQTTRSVRIHRLVAVAEYGIDAVAGKEVHHKNGIPWDNRPSNLEPLTSSEHRTLHNLRPEDCWDREPYPDA